MKSKLRTVILNIIKLEELKEKFDSRNRIIEFEIEFSTLIYSYSKIGKKISPLLIIKFVLKLYKLIKIIL